MTVKTDLPPRMRLKHAMTATAFSLVQIRQVWRNYLAQLQAERAELARRRRQLGR